MAIVIKTSYYKPYGLRITEQTRDFIVRELESSLDYHMAIKDNESVKEIRARLKELNSLRFRS